VISRFVARREIRTVNYRGWKCSPPVSLLSRSLRSRISSFQAYPGNVGLSGRRREGAEREQKRHNDGTDSFATSLHVFFQVLPAAENARCPRSTSVPTRVSIRPHFVFSHFLKDIFEESGSGRRALADFFTNETVRMGGIDGSLGRLYGFNRCIDSRQSISGRNSRSALATPTLADFMVVASSAIDNRFADRISMREPMRIDERKGNSRFPVSGNLQTNRAGSARDAQSSIPLLSPSLSLSLSAF